MKIRVPLLSARIAILGIAAVMAEAGISKFRGGQTPDWFLKQFAGTLIDFGPTWLAVNFWLIASAEIVAAIALFVGLIQFIRRRKFSRALHAGLLLTQALFLVLMIGLRLSYKFDLAFNATAYSFISFALHQYLHYLVGETPRSASGRTRI